MIKIKAIRAYATSNAFLDLSRISQSALSFLTFGLLLSSYVCLAQTSTAGSGGPPVLQVIVMGGLPGGDAVNITYPGVAEPVVLQNDLASLGHQLNIGNSAPHISTSGLPEAGGETAPMTSVTLTALGAAPLNTGRLPVDKLILALRAYRRLAITYIMPPNYRYIGFRRYSDQNVSVTMSQSGSTFLYSVDIRNPGIKTLSLPATDVIAPQLTATEIKRRNLNLVLMKVAAVAGVLAIATLAGWSVYRVLAKLR